MGKFSTKLNEGLSLVYEDVTTTVVTKEELLPQGCQRGFTQPENKIESDEELAKRIAIDDADEQEREDQENDEAADDNEGDASSNTGGSESSDHDGGKNDVSNASKPQGCGEGTPSYDAERCFENIADFCHCDECDWEPINNDPEDEEIPPEEQPEEEEQEEDDLLSGVFGTGVDADNEVTALEESDGPTKRELNTSVQTITFKSVFNGKIPLVFGSYIIEANIIHVTPVNEEGRFSMMASLVAGPMDNVVRVWFGDKLVFDQAFNTPNRAAMGIKYKVYSGRETQKITHGAFASIKGFGRNPAYRGMAYLLMEDIRTVDLEQTVPAGQFPTLRVEISSNVTETESLTFDDTYAYTNDFFKKDAVNNRVFGTHSNPPEWPEDVNNISFEDDTKFINTLGWDPLSYDMETPYAVTPDGIILQPNLGFDMKSGDYLKFDHPIKFDYDKYRVSVYQDDDTTQALVHRPNTRHIYAHTISRTYKCASADKYMIPLTPSQGKFLGFRNFGGIVSYHIHNDSLSLVTYDQQSKRGDTHAITLPTTSTSGQQPMEILGTTKTLVMLENSNQMIILDYKSNIPGNYVVESVTEYDTQPPISCFSNIVDEDYFYYIGRDNKVVEVDLDNLTFTTLEDVTLPGVIENYWYDTGTHSLLFVHDNKLWSWSGKALVNHKVSLKEIYDGLMANVADGRDIPIDVVGIPDIQIDGILIDDSYRSTLERLNELFGLHTVKDVSISVGSPDNVTIDSDGFGDRKYTDVIINYNKASLEYEVSNPPFDYEKVSVKVNNPTKPSFGTVYDKEKSFRFAMVANNIDFTPLLESHLVTINDRKVDTTTSQMHKLLTVGDITPFGQVSRIAVHPSQQIDVEFEPAKEVMPPEVLPEQPGTVDYLIDVTTQKNSLVPKVLFMPALTHGQRSTSLESQIAYTLIESPVTSGPNDSEREFHLPVTFNLSVRGDLRDDVWYRRYDDYWRNNPWNGRQAAGISKQADAPIFKAKKQTVRTLGHQYAAHSGTVTRNPERIPLNLDHRTTDNDSRLQIRFHHKNTLRFLKNQTALQLFNNFTNNMLVVGREYIQYQNFEVGVDGRTVTFTGLHRAQRGTDPYTASHLVGERAYLYTDDTFMPVRLNRLTTMYQPPVDMSINGSNNTYRVLGDAGSARPLAPLDIKFDYNEGDENLVVSWQGRSEFFYNMLTEETVAKTKVEGKLGKEGTQGLYIVVHVLTRPFEINNFEKELILGHYNDRQNEPLIWYTIAKEIGDIASVADIDIPVSDLHGVGIFPETDHVHFVVHYGYPVEQYERNSLKHVFKRGLVGQPAYRVMPPVAPTSPTQHRMKKLNAYTVLKP